MFYDILKNASIMNGYIGKTPRYENLQTYHCRFSEEHKEKDEDDRHIQFSWVHAEGRRRVLGVCYLAKLGPLDIRKLKVQHWTL